MGRNNTKTTKKQRPAKLLDFVLLDNALNAGLQKFFLRPVSSLFYPRLPQMLLNKDWRCKAIFKACCIDANRLL